MNQRCSFPLADLLAGVEGELKRVGYGPPVINRYRRPWGHLAGYMADRGLHYDTQVGLDFLEEVYHITIFTALTNEDRVRARAITVLNEYYLHGMVRPRYRTSAVSLLMRYSDVLTDFQAAQRMQRSPVTLQAYEKFLGKFLLYLENHNVTEFTQITAPTILAYTDMLCSDTPATLYNALGALRVFLRYLHTQGLVAQDWSPAVPNVRRPPDAHLPSTFSAAEIEQILGAVDRANPTGKRDYAMLLLAARLGLRSGDIRHLTFADLRWESNVIDRVLEKTGKRVILPLPEEVGMAIIDYAKYGRPPTDGHVIFLRHVPPIQPLTASALSGIVKRYMARGGVEPKPGHRSGPHAMRHSLASALLEDNVPLPVIAEILGHTHTRTTSGYLKIGVEQLRRCALPVPVFDWNVDKEGF